MIDAQLTDDEWKQISIAALLGAAGAFGSALAHWGVERLRRRVDDDSNDSTDDEAVASPDPEVDELRARVTELKGELALRNRVAALEAELQRLKSNKEAA